MYYRKSIVSKVLDTQNIGLKDKMIALDSLATNQLEKADCLDKLTGLIVESFAIGNNKEGVIELLTEFANELEKAKNVIILSEDEAEKPIREYKFGKKIYCS